MAAAGKPSAGLDQSRAADVDDLDIAIRDLHEGIQLPVWEDRDAICKEPQVVATSNGQLCFWRVPPRKISPGTTALNFRDFCS